MANSMTEVNSFKNCNSNKKQYLLYRTAGLGNQFYYFAYCDYLKRQGFKVVKLLNVGPKEYGDTCDKTKRNLILDIPSKLSLQRINLIGRIYLILIRIPKWFLYEQIWSKFIRIHKEPDLEWSKYIPAETQLFGKYNIHIGCFQSYHYISNDFLKKLSGIIGELAPLSKFIINKSDVAVHIRRGDFLTFGDGQIYNIVGVQYYLKGLKYIKSKIMINKIYIFSDDFNSIQHEVKMLSSDDEVVLVQNQTAMEDMNNLRQFRNYILGNSTFAWWGAMLSCDDDPNVIVPKTPWKKGMDNASMYPPKWIQIDN
jgi:hypothetical protein